MTRLAALPEAEIVGETTPHRFRSKDSTTCQREELSRPTSGSESVGKPVAAITGSSGLIGSALAAALRVADHRALRIVHRAPANSEELHWIPESGEFGPDALTDVDVVTSSTTTQLVKH
ncbi:hypothetical protein NJB1604_27940 [Mycobacterium marinum]|nr:hypothetical protein NJB1604_27940 [Mycobacterium marinum]